MYAGKAVERIVENRKVIFHEYLTLEEAADELGKSRRTVNTLHGSGLAKVQKVIDEREAI
jgi:DNA-directed RNA polymerase specialized sigma24 family protein